MPSLFPLRAIQKLNEAVDGKIDVAIVLPIPFFEQVETCSIETYSEEGRIVDRSVPKPDWVNRAQA